MQFRRTSWANLRVSKQVICARNFQSEMRFQYMGFDASLTRLTAENMRASSDNRRFSQNTPTCKLIALQMLHNGICPAVLEL